MKINEYGAVFLTPEELFESIYTNKLKSFENIYLDKAPVDQFNAAKNLNKDSFGNLQEYVEPEEDLKFFDEANQCTWFMPEECNKFPIHQWL